MKHGSVVLASLQQADGRIKIRPAVVLCEMPKYGDILCCGISSNLHQHVEGFDEMILEEDSDFKTSGLMAESLIRLGFLSSLPQARVAGVIGKISTERQRRLLENLLAYLKKTQESTF